MIPVLGMEDCTFSEVSPPPHDRLCASGHFAPPLFRREGKDGPEEPTRFFRVSTKTGDVDGVYCEPCLIIANHVARLKKKFRQECPGRREEEFDEWLKRKK